MMKLIKNSTVTLAVLLPASAFADWTGGYAGLGVGTTVKSELSFDLDGETASIDLDGDPMLDVFAGYQVQNGNLVFGGEFAISNGANFKGNFDGTDGNIDFQIIDIKGRAGFAVDDVLVYGVASLSLFEATNTAFDTEESGDGFSLGLGADYMISDQFTVGAEYLARRATADDELETDVDFDTLTLRAALNF